MKKTTFTLFLTLVMIASGNTIFAQNKQDIPQKITEYVAKHFPDNPIAKFEKDFDDGRVIYEVGLRDNTNLDFNNKMEVIKIDSNSDSKALPESVIPKVVQDHVKANYPNNFVVKWEKERRGYDVELNNDIDLKISYNGKKSKIDR